MKIVGVDVGTVTGVVVLRVEGHWLHWEMPVKCKGGPKHQPALIEYLTDLSQDAARVAIDAPFGWPDDFLVGASHVQAHQMWTDLDGELLLRATDQKVERRTGRRPISVLFSLNLLAVLAAKMRRGIGIDDDREAWDQKAVEVYPAAALWCWMNHQFRPYRGTKAGREKNRRLIVDDIQGALGTGNQLSDEIADKCVGSADLLDAVVAALVGLAVETGRTTLPKGAELQRKARSEGWIHLPEGTLQEMLAAL